ncbi:MAG TPA: sigma-54 dependent transcriptional regulator [Acidobacteriota bacterium]|nr:sigma-54 dependent transcriptional regulator [Acidobacteriota bacterium]
MPKVLIVDDETRIRRIIKLLLIDNGYLVHEASSAEEGLQVQKEQNPDMLLLDLKLPGSSGLEALPRFLQADPDLSVVMMTAHGSIRSAVEAMKAGAFDYLTKPFDNEELLMLVRRGLEMRQLSAEVESLREELEMRYGFSEIIGISPPMQRVFRVMSRVKDLDATVMVTGESGTGKELISRAIHRHSKRSAGPFVAVNCSAIPDTLIEAEFFGHERGAFTDAQKARPGKFEEAHGGTLFLDEVGDLPMEAQAKLLRVLQERTVTRLGASGTRDINVRVISATNRDLEKMASEGSFRKDLYWRLNVVKLPLPTLRDRREDLPLLIDFLMGRFRRELDSPIEGLTPEARQIMLDYAWPGNVRELENALCQSMILCDDTRLRPQDLPPRVRGLEERDDDPERDFRNINLAEAVAAATESVERRMIMSRLASHGGNRNATAESLGISRKTLFNKMKQLNIDYGPGQSS